MTEDAFLRGIAETPDDAALRLVYADWLDDHGREGRAELVRVCERMRGVPVFSDEYWSLKARRNELRPECPAEWLAATGYDGSRTGFVLGHGVPDDWRGRWRVIREFVEQWHGIVMGDVGGRGEVIRAEEGQLGLLLPPSLREYVAYTHDLSLALEDREIHSFVYSMQRLERVPALSVAVVRLLGDRFVVRYEDMSLLDPPIWEYSVGADGGTDMLDEYEDGPWEESVSGWVCWDAIRRAKGSAGELLVSVPAVEASSLREQLTGMVLLANGHGVGGWFAGDGVLILLAPQDNRLLDYGLDIRVSRDCPRERVPEILWPLMQRAVLRSGIFAEIGV